MINADDFINATGSYGFSTWSGVPCSYLTPFINRIIDDPDMTYVAAANEGDAVATASGAALAGSPAVAMMQNSGLGNAVSPLSSLNWVFRIPILLIITLRGEPGTSDEPQHELMGEITTGILDQLQIPWAWFPRSASDIEGALTVADWQMQKTARPYAFVMRKGSVDHSPLDSCWNRTTKPAAYAGKFLQADTAELTRREVLETLVACTSEAETVLIGTTGYTGRELFALADRPNHLYMVGSMGCASSFGLGFSLALPEKRVVVIDGDGAALMRMGNFATIGAYAGDNFQHLLLDNSMHESTGGQSTVSSAISFAAVASACGYRNAEEDASRSSLARFAEHRSGPSMLHFHTRAGVPDDLPRPDVSPLEVSRRLMAHLGITSNWSQS